ncbi:enoyl-CoA hydratase-related protein, partial [Escherichia coli]
ALVEGKCFGGGFEAVLACDYLIASESALFSFPEIKLGIFPGMGAASVMSRVLNKGDYQRIFLSGEMFSAQQLFDMGLVSQLVPDGQGEAVLRQFLKRMNSAACYQL